MPLETATVTATPISTAAQEQLFSGAHTPQAFTDEPVSAAQIDEIYELTKWAPTAFNAQPLRILIVQSDDARARLLQHVSGPNQAKVEQAPLTVILAADTNFHDHMHRTTPHFAGARDMFLDDAKRETFARSQSWLQAGYFIIGIRAAGLTAGPMTGYNAAGLDEDLLAGTGLKSIALINVGHADADKMRPRGMRFDKEEAVRTI